MSLTLYKTRCPHCGKVLNRGSYHGVQYRRIEGKPEFKPCPYCRALIWNGLKPREEMNKREKIVDFYSRFYGWLFYCFILLAVLFGFLELAIVACFFFVLFIILLVSSVIVSIIQSSLN